MVAVRTKSKSTAKSTKTVSRPAAKSTKTTRTTATRSTAKKPATTKAAPKRATATRTTAKPATRSTAKAPATRTRKKVEVTPTRTAKAANRRTGVNKPKSAAETRKKTNSRSVKTVAKPSAPTTGPNRVVDATTGFAIGTDSHVIATELLKGGETRAEVIERCAKKLPAMSNRGTPKPVANMVASVLGKMRDAGFTVSSSFILEPPTRASKARATRERNKRLNGG